MVSRFKFENISLKGFIRKPFFKINEEPWRFDGSDYVVGEMLGEKCMSAHVQLTNENYHRAIMEFDHPKVLPNDQMFIKAIDYVNELIDSVCPNHKPAYGEDLYCDFTKSPGYPLNKLYREKGDCPIEVINYELHGPQNKYIWQLTPKSEILPLTKIRENKIRTFMIPPFGYLIQQKIFSKRFNECLKKLEWVGLGFNFHHLGYDRLFRNISKFRYKGESDVKYWDKRFPLKDTCYDMRRRKLILTKEEEKIFEQLREQEIYPTVLLPSGELIEMTVGQCSGSENTSTDNTIAHIIIKVYEILTYYEDNKLPLPHWQEIFTNVYYKIFSDDNIWGCTEKYRFLCDPERAKIIYSRFGLTIDINDPLKWRTSESVIGMTFLGMKCDTYENKFIPTFPWQKVVDSSILKEKDETSIDQVLKFLALSELLLFTEYFDRYRLFIRNYCEKHDIPIPYLPTKQVMINKELCREGVVVNKFQMSNGQSKKRGQGNESDTDTRYPRTIEALTRVLKNNRTRVKRESRQRSRFRKSTKKRNEENKRIQTKTSKKRQRRYSGGRSQSNRQRSEFFYQERNRTRDQIRGRQNYTETSGRLIGNNNRNNRSVVRRKKGNPNLLNEIRRTGFETPMPFMQPRSNGIKGKYRDKGGNLSDGCIITGSEYFGTVNVNTTANTVPTQPGDVLKLIFANPLLLPATRLHQLAQLYEHFKFLEFVIEYVPTVSNIYAGDIGLAWDYDPDEPINLMVGSDVRRRTFMAYKGANLGRAITFLRCGLQQNEDTLKDYFVHPRDDGRQEMQAYGMVMAFTTFEPPTAGATTATLGEIIIHYKMKMDVRHLEPLVAPVATVNLTINGLANASFAFVAVGQSVAFINYGGTFSMRPNYIAVFTVLNEFKTGATKQFVDSVEGYQFQLFSQGSVWFGFVDTPNGNCYICDNVDSALDKNIEDAPHLSTPTFVGGATYTALMQVEIYDIGELPSPQLNKWRQTKEKQINKLKDKEISFNEINDNCFEETPSIDSDDMTLIPEFRDVGYDTYMKWSNEAFDPKDKAIFIETGTSPNYEKLMRFLAQLDKKETQTPQ